MDNNFKNGFWAGALMATVAGAIGFAMSKPGQEMAKEVKEDLDPWVQKAKKNWHRMREHGRVNLEELADELVGEYARKRGISDEDKKTLAKRLKSKWREIEMEYINEKF